MALKESEASGKKKYEKLVAAGVGLLVGGGVLYWGYARSQPQAVRIMKSQKAYAYDTQTHQLSVIDSKGPALSGGLVRAHVFSNGSCGDEKERWIGYLEQMTPEAIKVMEDIKPGHKPAIDSLQSLDAGTQVSQPDAPDQWVTEVSNEGVRIKQTARAERDGKRVVECIP